MEFSGSLSREKYKMIYTVFLILYSMYNTGLWICVGFTINYLKGSSGYYGAVIALASQMINMLIQVSLIRGKVSVAEYDKETCCGFYQTVRNNIIHAAVTILVAVVTIALSIAYGIRYGQNNESKIVNEDKNELMGIVNTIVASCVFLTSIITLYFSINLRKELLSSESAQRQGNFAGL